MARRFPRESYPCAVIVARGRGGPVHLVKVGDCELSLHGHLVAGYASPLPQAFTLAVEASVYHLCEAIAAAPLGAERMVAWSPIQRPGFWA